MAANKRPNGSLVERNGVERASASGERKVAANSAVGGVYTTFTGQGNYPQYLVLRLVLRNAFNIDHLSAR